MRFLEQDSQPLEAPLVQGIDESVDSSDLRLNMAAALRVALPDDRAGLLAVRSRTIDFVTTATVSAAMLYVAWTIDPLGTS